jgi:prolyl-tRNA synthetase
MLLNQWANVVRWELRTRFLRTTEFLQGGTAHPTTPKRWKRCCALDLYAKSPRTSGGPYQGRASRAESSPRCAVTRSGDDEGLAPQAGTSHDLGQNFAAFDVRSRAQRPTGIRLDQLGSQHAADRRADHDTRDKGLVLP